MAANIQAALNTLANVGVSATGPNALVTAVSSTVFTITFQNALAGAALPTMTFGDGTLTGGTISTLTTTTPGASTFNASMVASTGGTSGNTISAPSLSLGGTLGGIASTDGVVVTNNGSLTISGSITGLNSLAIAGGGTLQLPAANAYQGGSFVSGGTLSLGSGAALGSGAVTLTNGSLQASVSGGILIANNLSLNNANITLGGGNPLLFSGTVALGAVGTADIVNVANTAATVFNGIISGAAILTKTGVEHR